MTVGFAVSDHQIRNVEIAKRQPVCLASAGMSPASDATESAESPFVHRHLKRPGRTRSSASATLRGHAVDQRHRHARHLLAAWQA